MKLRNLMVMSLDGEITAEANESSFQRLQFGLTNKDDQELLHQEIAESDAVIIGANSVRSEGGILELKNFEGRYPTWCVYSNMGLDATLPFWKQDKTPRILLSQKQIRIFNANVESLNYGDAEPGLFLWKELKKRGFRKILLLGGGELNRLFYREALVDELKLTISPMLLAKGINRFVEPSLERPVQLELLSSQAKGSYLFLHYKVLRN